LLELTHNLLRALQDFAVDDWKGFADLAAGSTR